MCDRCEVWKNWDNSYIGILNNSSFRLTLLRKKNYIQFVEDKCSQRPSNRNDHNLRSLFIRFLNGIRLCEVGSPTERQIAFGHIQAEVFSSCSEPTGYCEILFSGSVRAASSLDYISQISSRMSYSFLSRAFLGSKNRWATVFSHQHSDPPFFCSLGFYEVNLYLILITETKLS